MTMEDCGNHGPSRQDKIRRIAAAIGALIVIVGLAILLVWAIRRPTKPRFVLQHATVSAFNLSQPNLLTSTFQITIAARNPNGNIGIYYDGLYVYATYRNQRITRQTAIPPTYQGHKEHNVWYPFIYGAAVPVAPFNADALGDELSRGSVTLMIRADGTVRWKVGGLINRRYHLQVKCPVYVHLRNKAAGIAVGENAVKYTLVTKCSVSV